MTIEYLSVTDVSKRLGISTAAVSAYKLPQPDALIGRTRGWLPDTIDQWNAQRPGRGVGGGRPRKTKQSNEKGLHPENIPGEDPKTIQSNQMRSPSI